MTGMNIQSDTVLHLLHQVPFLAPLSLKQSTALAAEAILQEYAAGGEIVREGAPGDSFFIVESGSVLIYTMRHDAMIELRRSGPGSFFGEMALLERADRSASVRAETPVRVLEISRAGFQRLLRESPDITLSVMGELSTRLRETDRKMIADLLRQNEELQLTRQRLEQSYDSTLIALGNALDLRDTETEGHSIRVAKLAVEIGRAMGLSERELRGLWHGGLLHDVGKIGVPDAILRKPRGLSQEEWAIMRQHPVWGAQIVAHVDFLADGLPIVRHHQEAWDGSGYPDGLAGTAIPLLARIFMVADAYDAISSDRPYRKARSPEAALAIIRAAAGRQFDETVVAAFEQIFPAVRAGS